MFEKIVCFLAKLGCHRKSPIAYNKLLRAAGQSASDKIEDIVEKYFYRFILLFALFTPALMINTWVILLYVTSLILLSVLFIKEVYPWKMGRDGERAMAQYLDIVAREYAKVGSHLYIYHDIINLKDKYNIDHIVISKKGIFIIDTKTYSTQKKTKNLIKSDGKRLYQNGFPKDHIVFQIKGQAKWLQNTLRKKLGTTYKIVPTLAFVGWFVEGGKINGVYITNAKNFKTIVENPYLNEIYDDEELIRITSVIHELSCDTNRKQLCCND